MGKVVHGHRQAAAPSVGMACFASVGEPENKGASSELHGRRQMERTVVLRPANEQNERQKLSLDRNFLPWHAEDL